MWQRLVSNQLPPVLHTGALPFELRCQFVEVVGFEPTSLPRGNRFTVCLLQPLAYTSSFRIKIPFGLIHYIKPFIDSEIFIRTLQ